MPAKVILGVRMSQQLKDRLAAAGENEDRSSSYLAEKAIRLWLDENHPKKQTEEPTPTPQSKH